MKTSLLLTIFTIVCLNLNAQSLKFYNEPSPGSLLFGKAESIKSIKMDDQIIPFSKEGEFVVGFDRDDTSSYLLVVETEGKTFLKKIMLPKRDYNIQRINRMAQKYVSPPQKVLNRIAEERKVTNAAKQRIGELKEPLFVSGFQIPIEGGRISSIFGSQRILNGVPKSPHNGIDIAVPKGTPVRAMTDGKVLLSADNFYYAGNFIIIDHGFGLNSMYLHLNESLVKKGQFVKKGEIIGKVGTTGRSTGPHLHWTVQWYNKRVDPNSVFNFVEE
jgi:murein DD-endopeptidase MepM/ murein hydrolase activator NlpD